MTYQIEFTKRASRMLAGITDYRIKEQIARRIRGLATDPEHQGQALRAELRGYRSIRAAGQRYRIVYKVGDESVTVYIVAVGIRKQGGGDDIRRAGPGIGQTGADRVKEKEGAIMVTSKDGGLPETMSLTEARAKLMQLPDELEAQRRALTLTRRGRPVMAVVPWELWDAIIETIEILEEPEMMEALRESVKDIKAGRTIPADKVFADLGLGLD